MNVKISENSICFKISGEELETLLGGEVVETRTRLPTAQIHIRINPQQSVENGASMQSRIIDSQMQIDLCVPDQMVQQLHEIGKSKTGLTFTLGQSVISLQVDIKSDKRKVKKGAIGS